MTLRLVAAAVLLATPFARAQVPSPAAPMMRSGPMPHRFGASREPVTNAPFTATFTVTSSEKLQDGTELSHMVKRSVFRDSLGRFREEVTLPARGNVNAHDDHDSGSRSKDIHQSRHGA